MTSKITTRKKPQQKLISFTEQGPEFEAVKADMESGWNIISLFKNGSYYVGIMEEAPQNDSDFVFIPPRKKIKISA